MDKKEMIIAGVVVVIALIVAVIIFAPSNEVSATTIELLNKGEIGENSTLYIKLTDWEKTALSNKTVHIKLTDSKNKTVYEKTVETHDMGVAIAKLKNVSGGNYTLEITFDGDENYKNTSFSQKVSIKGEPVEDEVDSASVGQTSTAAPSSSASTHHQQSQSRQSSSSSSDSSSDNTYYDENGKEITAEYDENGKVVDPSDE